MCEHKTFMDVLWAAEPTILFSVCFVLGFLLARWSWRSKG